MARLHKTTDKFIVEAREKIGSHYDFSKTIYQGIGVPTTISCPVHGDFTTTPKSVLLQGTACPTCRKQQRVKDRTSSRDDFISAANVAHGLVYDYSNVIYKTSMTKVEIVCPTHGPFSQTPNNHVSKKQGCPKCWQERRPGGIGGYTQGYFDKYPERKSIPATLYVIEMSCRTDHFM